MCVTVCAAGWLGACWPGCLVYATYRVAQFLVFLQANQVKKKRQKKKSDTQSHTHTHTGDVIWESIEREIENLPVAFVIVFLSCFSSPSLKEKMFFLASLERRDTSVDTYVLEFLIDSVGEIAFRYRNSHKQQQQQQQLLLKKPEREKRRRRSLAEAKFKTLKLTRPVLSPSDD